MRSPTRKGDSRERNPAGGRRIDGRIGLLVMLLGLSVAGLAGADFQMQGRNLSFSASAKRGRGQLLGAQPFLRLEENVHLQFESRPYRVDLRSNQAEARLAPDRRSLVQAEATGGVHVEVWAPDPRSGQPARLTTDCARVVYQAAHLTLTLYADPQKPALIVYQVEADATSRFELEFAQEFVLDLSRPAEGQAPEPR